MASPNNPNAFTDNPLDRASHLRADLHWLASARSHPDSRFIPLLNLKPLIVTSEKPGQPGSIGWVTPEELGMFDLSPAVFLGLEEEKACFAIDVSDHGDKAEITALSETGSFTELLAAIIHLQPRDASLLAQAKSMIDWHRRHGFCANCGAVTQFADAGYRRDCPECNTQHFPRTDPVVISLVIKNDMCLLGRNAMFKGPFFSALAGFLEPGESIEEAVAREVMEEVGIEVSNVKYHSTQPWPYPSSLMIGCIADAITDTITLDEKEIAEARWFSREQLRQGLENSGNIDYKAIMSGEKTHDAAEFVLPPHSAIAHQLLLSWVNGPAN